MLEAGIVALCFLGWLTAVSYWRRRAKDVPTRTRHTLHETFLVGLCMFRSGILESKMYDATVAHLQHQQQDSLTSQEVSAIAHNSATPAGETPNAHLHSFLRTAENASQ